MELPDSLVIDANILFSFFKQESGRRQIVKDLREQGCSLVSPDYVFEELVHEKERIEEFATISETEFVFLLSIFELAVETVDEKQYETERSEAADLAPHDKDVPYFSLALHLDAAIWSDETGFNNQEAIDIYSTEDLYDILNKNQGPQ